MESKKWYQSYTVWAGILEFAIGVLGLVEVYLKTGDYNPSSLVLLFTGILTIALRTITKVPLA